MRWIAVLILLSGTARAHDDHAPPTATQVSTEVTTSNALKLKLSVDPATVGELTRIRAELRDASGQAVPATFTMTVRNLDDNEQVLATAFAAPSGSMDWRQEFYDGDEHQVVVSALPTVNATNGQAPSQDAAQVATVASIKLPVTAISPPRPVIWRTFAYLLSVTALATALAYFASTRRLAAV